MKKILDIFAGFLLLGLASLSLFQFYMIATTGKCLLIEPNGFILWSEIGLGCFVVGYAIYYLARVLSRISRP